MVKKMATKKFKTKVDRLDQIVEIMSQDDLELEKAMKYFEEGMALIKSCEQDLDQAEAKVTVLMENDDGDTLEVPFGGQIQAGGISDD